MAAVSAPSAASPASGGGATHPYTCNTCQVAFRGSQQQRSHMQSDWHRYNLKRRVASLPPLSSEIFNEKVLANQASAAATAAKATFEKVCAPCQRTYYSENAYQNHLNSQKHRLKVAQLAESVTEDDITSMTSSALSLGEPIDVRSAGTATPTLEDPQVEAEFSQMVSGIKKASLKDVDPITRRPACPPHLASAERVDHPLSPSSIEPDSADDDDEEDEEDDETESLASQPKSELLSTCLFCNTKSASLDANVAHMHSAHSMFIPEQAYLVDLAGLVGYLHARVRGLHECLYCGQTKHSLSGIQTHMRDKGHCMIAFESEEQMIEVGEFYDFRATYSDADSDEDEEDDDEEWEDDDTDMADSDSDASDSPADAPTKPPAHTRKPKHRPADMQPVYFDSDGLHLPSGRIAGHRSLSKYFRQNLRHYPTLEERAAARQLALENGDSASTDDGTSIASGGSVIKPAPRGRPGALTRADGGLGLLGATDAKKREARAVELADRKRVQRAQKQYQWGNEKRANNQKHFRDPLLQ